MSNSTIEQNFKYYICYICPKNDDWLSTCNTYKRENVISYLERKIVEQILINEKEKKNDK